MGGVDLMRSFLLVAHLIFQKGGSFGCLTSFYSPPAPPPPPSTALADLQHILEPLAR